MQSKVCTKCHQEKPLNEFVKKSRNKSGYGSYCTECNRSRNRTEQRALKRKEWVDNNPEKTKVIGRFKQLQHRGMNIFTILRPEPELCEICGEPAEMLCCDHDHSSSKFRGWVCHKCNRNLATLDQMLNDLNYYDSIINYLKVESANNVGVEIPKREFYDMVYATEFNRAVSE
jgi:Recombination endonuclease VII